MVKLNWRKSGFDRGPVRFFPRRQLQIAAEPREWLVDGEPWFNGCELEQYAARFAKIDRLKILAIQYFRHSVAAPEQLAPHPQLLITGRNGERDVVHRAQAIGGRNGIGRVEDVDDLAGLVAIDRQPCSTRCFVHDIEPAAAARSGARGTAKC